LFLNEELIPFSVFKYHLELALRGMESGLNWFFQGVRFNFIENLLNSSSKICFLG
jgi:hypothetical protein